MMRHVRAMFVLCLAVCAPGCDLAATYRKCGLSGCPGDATITASIEDRLSHRADVFANDISVQTLNRVVYLRGLVDSTGQRESIVAAARSVAGVEDVVDSLVLRNDPGF